MPLDFLLRLMRDPQTPIARRLELQRRPRHFLHEKLNAIDAKLSPPIAEPSPERPLVQVEFVVPGVRPTRDDQE